MKEDFKFEDEIVKKKFIKDMCLTCRVVAILFQYLFVIVLL